MDKYPGIDIDKIRQEMREIQNERKKFSEELISKGHTCIKYKESMPVQIRWCCQEICTNK